MSDVLLLNRDLSPINVLPLSVIGWQHAVKLMCLGKVTVLETYPDWKIHSPTTTMEVPSVCMTNEYFNYKKSIRFSRANVYLRDLFQCQYCADTFDYEDLTIDHVIPRYSGGKTTWDNTVTSCFPCNSKKGHKHAKPLRAPYKPDYYGLLGKWKSMPVKIKCDSWYQYLGIKKPE